MQIERKYSLAKELLDKKQSLLILGPRATGKTYFLTRLLTQYENSIQINLLNSAEYERFITNPENLYAVVSTKLENIKDSLLYVLIDEVQRIPILLNEVHRLIEDYKGKVIFILTGSSARKLRRDENSNLLAGRAISINFFPLSSHEIDFNKNLNQILSYGTLPENFLEEPGVLLQERLKTYVGTYLLEEIQRESEIRRIDKFSKFLEFAASLNGSPVNYSKIAKALGVSPPTVREYFSILVDTLIAYSIPAWTYSVKKQIKQAPKFYFFDNGVLNSILGDLGAELKSSTYRYGKLFENLVVTEIYRKCDIDRLPLKLFNYNTNTNQEVDLILQKNPNSTPVAIEIKSSNKPISDELTSLKIFSNDYPNAKCIVICNTPREYKEEKILFCPLVQGIDRAIDLAMK